MGKEARLLDNHLFSTSSDSLFWGALWWPAAICGIEDDHASAMQTTYYKLSCMCVIGTDTARGTAILLARSLSEFDISLVFVVCCWSGKCIECKISVLTRLAVQVQALLLGLEIRHHSLGLVSRQHLNSTTRLAASVVASDYQISIYMHTCVYTTAAEVTNTK